MDSQGNNKRKWKNRDVVSSLEFALTGIFTAFKEAQACPFGFGSDSCGTDFWLVRDRMALSIFEHFSGHCLWDCQFCHWECRGSGQRLPLFYAGQECQGYGSGSCSGRVWLCCCDRTDYFCSQNLGLDFLKTWKSGETADFLLFQWK